MNMLMKKFVDIMLFRIVSNKIMLENTFAARGTNEGGLKHLNVSRNEPVSSIFITNVAVANVVSIVMVGMM